MKIITTKGVATAVPLLDDNRKPIRVDVKHNGIKRNIIAHETVHHPANTVLDLDDATAAELIAIGHAVRHDEALAPSEPASADPLA